MYIKASCVPETSQTSAPYCVWMMIRHSGWVLSGGYTCVAYVLNSLFIVKHGEIYCRGVIVSVSLKVILKNYSLIYYINIEILISYIYVDHIVSHLLYLTNFILFFIISLVVYSVLFIQMMFADQGAWYVLIIWNRHFCTLGFLATFCYNVINHPLNLSIESLM